MPAPEVAVIRVPFCYAPSSVKESSDSADGSDATTPLTATPSFVTNVFVEVISFNARFFWVHVTEESAGPGTRLPPSPLGCCATAIAATPASGVSMPSVNSTLWLDGDNSVHGGGGGGMDEVQATTTTVQAAFATSLAQKLSRRMQKSTGRPCVVHASCGVSGETAQSYLGTDSGGGFNVTAAFSALVFREALNLLQAFTKAAESVA